MAGRAQSMVRVSVRGSEFVSFLLLDGKLFITQWETIGDHITI